MKDNDYLGKKSEGSIIKYRCDLHNLYFKTVEDYNMHRRLDHQATMLIDEEAKYYNGHPAHSSRLSKEFW